MPALGPEYKIDGCGQVLATFDPDGYLVDLWVSPRAASDRRSIDDPDPADWSVPAAFRVASNFIPMDTECANWGTVPNPTGYIIQQCSGPALRDQVPQSAWDYSDSTPTYGSYAVFLHTNSKSGIYAIQLTLEFNDEDFPTT